MDRRSFLSIFSLAPVAPVAAVAVVAAPAATRWAGVDHASGPDRTAFHEIPPRLPMDELVYMAARRAGILAAGQTLPAVERADYSRVAALLGGARPALRLCCLNADRWPDSLYFEGPPAALLELRYALAVEIAALEGIWDSRPPRYAAAVYAYRWSLFSPHTRCVVK